MSEIQTMHPYEVLYILHTDQEETAIKALIEKFNAIITSNGGAVEKTDEWGKRRLAYVINYQSEGYYVLTHFSAAAGVPAELERNFKINEGVLRYLITRRDD